MDIELNTGNFYRITVKYATDLECRYCGRVSGYAAELRAFARRTRGRFLTMTRGIGLPARFVLHFWVVFPGEEKGLPGGFFRFEEFVDDLLEFGELQGLAQGPVGAEGLGEL